MLEGLNELFANLDSLGGNIKEAAEKGLHRGAKKIQASAKLLVPVGETGHLRNSIKTKSETTEVGVEAKVYTNLEYAPYVEFGTGQRGQASNIDRPEGVSYKADWKGMSARPYLTPSYLWAKNNNIIEKELVQTLQKEIRKMERGSK